MDTEHVEIYDTTLRDGSQQVGLDFTVEDKLRVARRMDALGVHVIEGGWPGSNPKDVEFFRRAKEERWQNAALSAFGSTRRPRAGTDDDPNLLALVESGAPMVALVGKAWTLHVTEALRTTYDENIAMVAESVAFMHAHGRRVAFDAEHFFDGYQADPAYALAVLEAAAEAGAETVVLCDTNGGTLPHRVAEIVRTVVDHFGGMVRVGGHFHEDAGCSVANSLIAVVNGATHIQGAANGYGERCGNADLFAVIAGLELKEGLRLLPEGKLAELTATAEAIADLANFVPDARRPYVGSSAFATKAGLHASAIARCPRAYAHVEPELVGNSQAVLVSELAGRSNLVAKAAEMGLDLGTDAELCARVLERIKELENVGFAFELADASFELLVREAAGQIMDGFELVKAKVDADIVDGASVNRTQVGVRVNGELYQGQGRDHRLISALNQAMHDALDEAFPLLAGIGMVDFKVRVLDGRAPSLGITRVLVTMASESGIWTTLGVSEDLVTACWNALKDGYRYALAQADIEARVAS